MLQIMIASTNEGNANGVSEILQVGSKTLKQVFIMMVVPEDRVDNYLVLQRAATGEALTNGRY